MTFGEPPPRWYRLVDHKPVRVFPKIACGYDLRGERNLARVLMDGWPQEYTIEVEGHWSRFQLEELQREIEHERAPLLEAIQP